MTPEQQALLEEIVPDADSYYIGNLTYHPESTVTALLDALAGERAASSNYREEALDKGERSMDGIINDPEFVVVHPDDIAVDRFAEAMKAKMAKQRTKGYGGWENSDPAITAILQQRLLEHIVKGDPVDVGNFAMMLWNRREPTAMIAVAPEHETVQQEPVAFTDEMYEAVLQEANRTFLHYRNSIRGQMITNLDNADYHIAAATIKLYTSPQPDLAAKVAELEAKLAEEVKAWQSQVIRAEKAEDTIAKQAEHIRILKSSQRLEEEYQERHSGKPPEDISL